MGVVGEHQLGVGAADRVGDHHLQRARRGGQRVAEAGDVDAEQLEFGGQVGAGELGVAAEQPVGDDFGGRVAGADQAVAAALDRRDLADRVDVRDRLWCRLKSHDNAAALADVEAGRPGQLVAWPDSGREHQQRGVDHLVVAQR